MVKKQRFPRFSVPVRAKYSLKFACFAKIYPSDVVITLPMLEYPPPMLEYATNLPINKIPKSPPNKANTPIIGPTKCPTHPKSKSRARRKRGERVVFKDCRI